MAKPWRYGSFVTNQKNAVLSAWAKHFRNHYCLDEEIDYLRQGYGYSRAEYLTKIKLPDASEAPGPSIRSGDLGKFWLLIIWNIILGSGFLELATVQKLLAMSLQKAAIRLFFFRKSWCIVS